MCHLTSLKFGEENLSPEEVIGKEVIEVGSYNMHGSLRGYVESQVPAKYIGVDIQEGEGVDIICRAEDIVEKFGEENFDIVISTETFEHIKDWKSAISNIKNICKPNGIILITTRSKGYLYHPSPNDYWRYEIKDMKYIFSDCIIEKLEEDSSPRPGVFLKARKPVDFVEKDLSDYKVFRITRFNDYLRRIFNYVFNLK